MMRPLLPGCLAAMVLACAPPAVSEARNKAPSVADVYEQVVDAVVFIEIGQRAQQGPTAGHVMSVGLGSGVLVSKEGLVLTAAHVVQTADAVRVHFEGHENIAAKVLRSDPAADVALLQLEWVPSDVEPVEIGDSDAARVGEQVFVLGAPHGLSRTLSVGHLSARHEPDTSLMGLSVAELFQTDASINQGNSGGPMFNMRGEVIGIVSHIVSMSGGSEGLGFAVTANSAIEMLTGKGSVWTGVDWVGLSGELAEAFNLPQAAGILVQSVAEGSLGHQLGLRGGTVEITIDEQPLLIGGDIVLEVQGVLVSPEGGTRERYRAALEALEPGDPIRVSVLRGGEVVELSAPFELPEVPRP